MLFYIHYKRTFDDALFKLWLNHYNITKIPYNIYVDKEDIDFFVANYQYTKNIINIIPDNVTLLTEYDFLMSYAVDENDIMILSYNIDHNELLLENNCVVEEFVSNEFFRVDEMLSCIKPEEFVINPYNYPN